MDMLNILEHLAGIIIVTMICIFAILVSTYTLFDRFLSFKEFGEAIRRWEKGENKPGDEQYTIAMALRSGLVFLGIAIIMAATFMYLDS